VLFRRGPGFGKIPKKYGMTGITKKHTPIFFPPEMKKEFFINKKPKIKIVFQK